VLTQPDVPWMSVPTAAGMPMNREAAMRLLDVWACMRLLAETASTIPMVGHRGDTPFPDGVERLLRRPAPGTTMPGLVGTTVLHMAATGEAFWGLFADERGEVAQLAAIQPDHVGVELVGGVPFYTLHLDSGATVVDQSAILHVKLLSWDGIRGVSPLTQARESLGMHAAVVEHAASLFGNAAIPRGVLAVRGPGGPDDPTGDERRENLAAGFKARHGGRRNQGHVAVIDADEVSYAAISLSAADAELIASRRLGTTEIARLLRVPAALIDAETGSSLVYTNAQQAADNLVRFSLQPYFTAIEAAITEHPGLTLPDEEVAFDLSAFLRPVEMQAPNSPNKETADAA
jgi:HK97 family phage portal protein